MTLDDINTMPHGAFVTAFGGIAEHSAWVAERAAAERPFADRRELIAAFAAAVHGASEDARLKLLNAHPDLAGKAALAGDLTESSKAEQAGAGLDTLTPEEFDRFTRLNEAYKQKFSFPFIYAVKGATKHDILAAFEERIAHDKAREFDTAIAQVCRILRFRIEDRVAK